MQGDVALTHGGVLQAQPLYEALVTAAVTGGGADGNLVELLVKNLQPGALEVAGKSKNIVTAEVIIGSEKLTAQMRMSACKKCGREEGLRLCGRCKSVKYCCVGCSVAAWPLHKRVCKYISANLLTQ